MDFNFPKIELHLHLDGAVPVETWWSIAEREGVKMPTATIEEFRDWLVKTSVCDSVPEYLERFDLPLQIMQSKENITEITESLIDRLEQLGYGYAEIRFAPQFHCRNGLTQKDAVEAVLQARENALKRHARPGIGILLCCMSIGPETVNMDENFETVRLAKEYQGKGVVGLDLAGAEGIVPLTNFSPLFDLARELGVPYTLHAENDHDAVSVREVMDMGAWRIGHGHRLYNAPELWERAKKNRIALEICPSSNIQCKTQPSYKEHPAKKLFDEGIMVTINTDNSTLAAVTLEDEYRHCIEDMGFENNDLVRMNIYAAEAAFMPENEKKKLIEELEQYLITEEEKK